MRTIKCLSMGLFIAILMAMVTIEACAKKVNDDPAVQAIGVLISSAGLQKIPRVLTAFGHMEAMQQVDLTFSVDGRLTQILAHSGQRVEKGQEVMELDDASDLALLRSLQAKLDVQRSTYLRMVELEKYGGVSAQDIELHKAAYVAAQADVQQQQALIAEKKVFAPFTGVLGIFQYDVGAYVSHGTAVVHLVQQAPLNALYSVPSTYKSQVEIGQTVEVVSNVYPNKIFSGIVNFISPEVNANSGTVTLQAKVDNPDYLLSPGMFVSVTQVLDPNRQLLMVPDVALMTDVSGQYVFKISANQVVKTYVTVGLITQSMAEITSGLNVGDRVVTAGQQKLSDGSFIKILNPQLPAPSKSNALPAVSSNAGKVAAVAQS